MRMFRPGDVLFGLARGKKLASLIEFLISISPDSRSLMWLVANAKSGRLSGNNYPALIRLQPSRCNMTQGRSALFAPSPQINAPLLIFSL